MRGIFVPVIGKHYRPRVHEWSGDSNGFTTATVCCGIVAIQDKVQETNEPVSCEACLAVQRERPA